MGNFSFKNNIENKKVRIKSLGIFFDNLLEVEVVEEFKKEEAFSQYLDWDSF